MSEIPGIDPSHMPDFESAEDEHKAAHARLHVADAKHFVGHMLDTMIFASHPNPTVGHFEDLTDKAHTRLSEIEEHVDAVGGHVGHDEEQNSDHCLTCGHVLTFPTLLRQQGLL